MADPKDDAQAALAAVTLPAGERYHHYKDTGGVEYEIVACGIQEDTLEPVVIYRSLTKGTVWVRLMTSWNEKVDFNGQHVKRFQKIG